MNDTIALLAYGDTGWGDELLAGAVITLQLAVCALGFGLLFGLALAGARLSHLSPLRWAADAYNGFIRATPEFLILLLVYYGFEQAVQSGLNGLGIDFAFQMPKFMAAVLGLSLIFACYASEVFRGAYLAVPRGQIEAAVAAGMSPAQVFLRIRLPQMWRYAIPGLGNLWMVLLKDTSLAAVIAVDDLLRQAKIASETTREPLLFYLTVAVIYLIMTGLSDLVRMRVEAASRKGLAEARPSP